MAQIESGGNQGHGKHDKKKRAKKLSTRIDMTPMVDLAFLLLTFFVLTSTFSKPKVLRLIFPPRDMKAPPTKLKGGLSLIVSGDNKLYYFMDNIETAKEMIPTDYSKNGLRKLLREKNIKFLKVHSALQKKLNETSTKDSAAVKKINAELDTASVHDKFVVIVKHDDDAAYRNIIDVVDEFLINQVGKYIISDAPLNELEKKALERAKKKL